MRNYKFRLDKILIERKFQNASIRGRKFVEKRNDINYKLQNYKINASPIWSNACFIIIIIKYRSFDILREDSITSRAVGRCQCFHYKGGMVHYLPIISEILLKAAKGNCFCY